jgi:hydrogenase-4 component F
MDEPLIAWLCVIPLLMGVISCLFRGRRALAAVDIAGSAAILVLAAAIAARVAAAGAVRFGFLYVDDLAVVFILIVGLLAFATAIYSVHWFERAVSAGEIPAQHLWIYFLLLDGFLFTMLLTVASDNLGVLWIAMEGTTIASALLVGFHGRRDSLEAAWKYIVVTTVGIALGLFGTVLFYAAAAHAVGPSEDLFRWTRLASVAAKLDPTIVKVAFIFVFIGYGTKAGLAPMHAWLPDAHSEAPSPVSALLSGALIKCAIFALLRFHAIAAKACGPEFGDRLFLAFGLVSIVIATPFILLQRDAKRLLGYHSVEHVGIIAAGIGFGGAAGIYAALLHTINHAVTKALVFFAVGDVVSCAGSREMHRIRGLIDLAPFAATILLLGAFSLAGTPPFSIFVSELLVLRAAIEGGQLLAAGVFLASVAVIFGGLVHHVGAMAFGKPGRRLAERAAVGESRWSAAAMLILAVPMIVFGLSIPSGLDGLLARAAGAVLRGGSP